jgi:hypothetical protein
MKQYRIFANNQEIGGCSGKKDAIKMAKEYAKDNHCDVQIWLGNIIIYSIKFN